ncbi:MAG: acyl-CoA thioesterase [Phycisphaeraceae bacterium]|nr:acyl-CoA thioesterase [Phycisphaerales bacterium]MCB9858942.1 acyl-CoA thioesterase [Phycisphaeraceae bacterium]
MNDHVHMRQEGKLRVRVRYIECDAQGIAHHANYGPWLEMGRTELLRDAGTSYKQLEASGVFIVVTRMEIVYRRPIRYDDVIEIETLGGSSTPIRLRHEYRIRLIERNGLIPDIGTDSSVPVDGICARATTEVACVDADGKPIRVPDWLVHALGIGSQQ